MTLLVFDGFDGYSAIGDIVTYGQWTRTNGDLSSTVRTGTGKSMSIGGNSSTTLTFPNQNGKTIYFGYALKWVNSGNTEYVHVGIGSALALLISPTGYLYITRTGAGTLCTASAPLLSGTWYYIELKIKVHSTTGIADIKVNETSVATFSGNTYYDTNDISSIKFGYSGSGTQSFLFDDVYIANGDGTLNNTYLGEVRAQFVSPNGDSSVQFTRSAAAGETLNYQCVDDSLSSPDSSYVYSSTSGNKDLYNLTTLTGVDSVAGVKVITRAQKDDTNPLSLKTGISISATEQTTTHILAQGYGNFSEIYESNDGAGTPITSGNLDDMLSLIEVV